jgi:hypothetical protein
VRLVVVVVVVTLQTLTEKMVDQEVVVQPLVALVLRVRQRLQRVGSHLGILAQQVQLAVVVELVARD